MGRPRKYSPEVRERAVRLVFDHEHQHDSQWATIWSVADKPGFPIWLWYFWPSDQSSRLDCHGFPEKKQATEGDTQWVNDRPSPFSSRSTDF